MKRIPLRSGGYTLVDDEDYPYLSQFTWRQYKSNTCPARMEYLGNKKYKTILMSREIMGAPPDLQVDHINGKNCDNQRHNLRLCTVQQNAWNQKSNGGRSRYKGVCWNARKKKWQANLWKGQSFFLGYTDTQRDAAILYDVAAQFFFGDFARLNFPSPTPHDS